MYLITTILSSQESMNPNTQLPNNNEKIIFQNYTPNNSDKDEVLKHYNYDFTEEMITKCVNACGFTPKSEYVQIVAKNIRDIPVQQRAMFLAQIIHESKGLTKLEEEKYEGNKKAPEYDCFPGKEGKSYYGRGFIQLSYPYNYDAASEYLKLGKLLLNEPELVCENLDYAWGVTKYFWLENVSRDPLVQRKLFWATTFRINGSEVCEPGDGNDLAKLRWIYYKRVSKTMGEKNRAKKGKDEMLQAIKAKQEKNEKITAKGTVISKQKNEEKEQNSEGINKQKKLQIHEKPQWQKDTGNSKIRIYSNEKHK